MYLLREPVTSVHIIKLQIVTVGTKATEITGIIARKIHHLLHHHTSQREHEWLAAVLGIDTNLLFEVSHLSGVIGSGHFKRISLGDGNLRIVHCRAATTGAHLAHRQRLVSLILNLKFDADRLPKQDLSAVYHRMLGLHVLRVER